MTTPTSGATPADPTGAAPAPATASVGAIEESAVQAIQVGIQAAHAAVWTYGLISAYDRDDIDLIKTNRFANEQIRDSASDVLKAVGVDPARTEAAYQVPVAVGDRASALQVAILIERDCTNAWRAVVGATDNYQLRRLALTALSDAAVRLTQWRTLAGVAPATVPFPGDEPV